ncbi:ABC transporter ATP-binding protein [Parvularcula flava]|uniref:ABC transporter ATP-binding protein n=1 Tax=Aquisalinus luteolus TaxID=1566827 RepID=A0A8J3A1U9_9PROT|nr:ABC transporter ATP-binding protein [Aquisalinus luteolus]NHK27719.1 ABC transporter ATP-binding protein [Aquisalinus luteolus]GGH96293.1 lipoprotein-releasing system ATP-binding protein LolD [Aquisalinus luteolus]
MSDTRETVLHLEKLDRFYGELKVLEGVDFTISKGEIVALLGPSGSGKSSLLHVAGLLEPPTSGEVYINGRATSMMNDAERTRLRRDTLGFVYQFHHLQPEFTALGNVSLPQLIAGRSHKQADIRSTNILTNLGLAERLQHQPAQLSGGEKQRVAIARALANEPSLLLADEPTGNLDVETSGRVFDALLDIVQERGLAALIATHDRALAARMDRVVAIKDRRLVQVEIDESTVTILGE